MTYYSDFFKEMIARRDMAATEAMGLPQVRSLIIDKRDGTFTTIAPYPIIVEATPDSENLDGVNNVRVTSQKFEVKGVSKKFPLEELVGQGYDYWVDGKLEEGEITEGILCSYSSYEEDALTWNLTLESRIGEQQSYVY